MAQENIDVLPVLSTTNSRSDRDIDVSGPYISPLNTVSMNMKKTKPYFIASQQLKNITEVKKFR